MGTKFFDVDDLKSWYKGKEGVPAKSRRMIEQISRMFEVPTDGKYIPRRLSAEYSDFQLHPISPSTSDTNIRTSKSQSCISSTSSSHDKINNEGKEVAAEVSNTDTTTTTTTNEVGGGESNGSLSIEDSSASGSSNFLSYELCSIILNKLLKVHSEYQTRFGSGIIVSEETGAGAGESTTEKATTTVGEALSSNKENNSVEVKKSGAIKEFFSRLLKSDCVNVNSEQTVESIQVADSILTESNNAPDPSTTTTTAELCPLIDDDGVSLDEGPRSNFVMIDSVPDTHRYRLTSLQAQNQKTFIKAVQKEVALMRGSLPDGIFVKAFEDRMVL